MACAKGDYFNIDANVAVQQIETPFDDQIIEQNRLLNNTYIGYGSVAIESKSKQLSQDANAFGVSKSVETERYLVKSKTAERATIQKEMARLEAERNKYIAAEKAKANTAKTVGFD